MIRIEVQLDSRSYPVLVGRGALDELITVLPAGARRAAIVTQQGIGVEVDTGLEQEVFLMGEGEGAKSFATVETLTRAWARWGLTRSDCVVAVGGGVVTDTAGFAASVYHRGVAVIHVATTLLGQIDAAVGGKTAVNLPEGKNLAGTFWQPSAVLCDTAVLDRLPDRERRSGMGEMAKYAFLGVDDLTELSLEEAVAARVRCKAAVVASDEREGGPRALLNYGHTLGHALETVGVYDLRHGEAVAIGLVYAARLARRLGRVGDAEVSEHERVVSSYDLPTRLPSGADPAALVEAMARDKKKGHDGLTFVLAGSDGLAVVSGVELDPVLLTLEEMR